jgi:hypothetical protein
MHDLLLKQHHKIKRLYTFFEAAPKGLKTNTILAGCCLSEVDAGDGTSSVRQVFFGDFL